MAEKSVTKAKSKEGFSTDGVIAQHDERVATQMARDAFSRERFQFLLRIIFGTMALLAVSIALNIFLATRPVKDRFFAVDPEGGIRQVEPLDRPIQSTSEVLNWSADALTKAFTLSFANYPQQLGEYKLNFTEDGWVGYQEALKRNKVLDTIVTQQFVTNVVPTGSPIILTQGIVGGNRYGWKIQMPILITWESASIKKSDPMTIEAVIVRRDPSENPRGLGIEQIVAK